MGKRFEVAGQMPGSTGLANIASYCQILSLLQPDGKPNSSLVRKGISCRAVATSSAVLPAQDEPGETV